MESNSRATAITRSRRRANEACTFCRRRKIKCNAEKPVCANCTIYGKQCSYEPISEEAKEAGRERHHRVKRRREQEKHRRPSGRRGHQRQGSSVSLSTAEQEDSSSATSPASQKPRGQGQQEEDEGPRQRQKDPAASRASLESRENTVLEVSNDARDGPSVGTPWHAAQEHASSEAQVARILVSANGESSYHGRTSALFEDNIQERPTGKEQHPRMPDDWVERGLVAEAVRQRQMEGLNFRQGKLDFDGEDPELGMHLLDLHWNRQHHSFLVTYRPAFMRDMACGGPYFSKLLLNAIYFGASKFSPRLEVRRNPEDVRTAGWKYRERVRELLGKSLDRSDVTTIQALLVMTNSLFALGDERSAAWLYAGIAFRMLIDLGMHVDPTSTRRFSDEDLEIRRRVFWGAFVIDKIQSLYQGRPVSLKEVDAVVPIKFLDSYEELEHWQPFAYSTSSPGYLGSPAYSTSTFTYLCRLSLTMSDILSSIYTERSHDQSPAELACMLDKLQLKLDGWWDSLPAHLRFSPVEKQTQSFPPPHVFSLHAMHHVLVILLHRPFVADGHLYSTSRSISVDSFMKCASAASSIVQLLRAYHQSFSTRRAPYLISYSTYVAATILTRIAAKRSNDSTAHFNLAICLAVFNENQETNSAVYKASMIVQGLMKRLGVVIGKDLLAKALQADVDKAKEATAPLSDLTEQEHESQAHEQRPSAMSTADSTSAMAPYSGTSPDSDWMDVDGIIQSFLEGYEGNAASQQNGGTAGFVAKPSWLQASSQPQATMGPEYAVGNGSVLAMNPDTNVPSSDTGFSTADNWQSNWRPTMGDQESLEDPLFGFNGPSLDSFAFISW